VADWFLRCLPCYPPPPDIFPQVPHPPIIPLSFLLRLWPREPTWPFEICTFCPLSHLDPTLSFCGAEPLKPPPSTRSAMRSCCSCLGILSTEPSSAYGLTSHFLGPRVLIRIYPHSWLRLSGFLSATRACFQHHRPIFFPLFQILETMFSALSFCMNRKSFPPSGSVLSGISRLRTPISFGFV